MTFDQVRGQAEFVWSRGDSRVIVAAGWIRCAAAGQLTWEAERYGERTTDTISARRNSIRSMLERWLQPFPTHAETFTAFWVSPNLVTGEEICEQEPPFGPDESIVVYLENQIADMARGLEKRLFQQEEEEDEELPPHIRRYQE
ncbi:MAG TPA: hypothetical protein VF988_04655, partial [Verrucomicrobiae bacterium]